MLAMNDDELKKLFETSEANTRRHFDVVAESVREDVRLVAEGLGNLGAKMTREILSVHEEMKHGFSETQAMIKFSYVELDRRVTSLEARVEKLEARR